MTLSQLKKFTPDYQWQGFIQQWKLSDEQLAKIIVENDSAVEQLAKILANTPLSTLQDYLVFHYLSSKANYLNQAFSYARFNFYSTRLNGIKQQRSRKERALEVVNKLKGEPLGQLYVATYFDPDAKNKIQNLVSYIKGMFKTRLQNNDWMDKRTCQKALKKLNQFTVKIGYPEKCHDFSTFHLQPDTLFDNHLQVQNWLYQDNMSRIGEKVRKWEWGMTPQTINAYYNPLQNEIIFPAAILQAPFFDQNADPAYNYGAIGAVIGHEMGHGFDDQGRLYDETGQLRKWWSTASQQHFKEKTVKLINQYNNGFKIDGLAVNDKLTLGENIGDLGGLNVALNAYKQFSKEHYPNGEPPIIDGMTGLQRFSL
ncbi:Neutral endopeptidase [Arsenophonus endosymbiont of Bemisia tabaci Q2]|nr:Neutral endopeptidase [Arsenophonus endosymbiont of Bemisia tabaci Q2]